ncbi:Predicted arabinose efflux permease, MFS family [Pseudomonas mucidolens]|uniref:Predicted arabinose efflux permease, MFS family n=2 Tax=Pseudomonas mucidolens TaxID=46679 RepID=A0A1H2MTR7_9PSED|nr:Predicted arabinose efflux permease, MFS family [Pseudomonas mucidolens]SQH33236.1 major facilitator transporter [Pseudomonas mucidolens]
MSLMTRTSLAIPAASRQVWGAVLAMALCAFALVTSEFLPVSLLTPLAADLALSEGQAGQAISISGIFAVITSLFIASVIRRLDRRPVLLGLTALMMASGTLVALAPNYTTLMIGRAILGIAVGGSWSMSTAVILRIAPEHFVPKAIAMIQGGTALATAIAAPVGSYMGGLIGWRGAFFCVVPLAAVALCWQALTLPKMPSDQQVGSTMDVFRLLGSAKVALGMAAVGFVFMGQFALFTYLRPFLESVTQVDGSELSLLLLIIGMSGLAGTMLIGSVLNNNLYRVLMSIPLLMSGITVALLMYGSSIGTVALLLGAWGLIATCAPVGWFTWLSRTLPQEAETGDGLMVAVIQLAITLGATVGGVLYDGVGYQATLIASAAFLLVAAMLAWMVSRTSMPHVMTE